MSDYKAIRGVSSTLRSLLKDRMEKPVPVLLAPPDVAQSSNDGKRLNLYLYQLTQNRYLENQEIPGTGHPSQYGSPPLSLDLYYLLTSYGESDSGADSDLEAQEVLGDAMRVLHDFPVITPGLHQADDESKPLILDSTLVEEFERIKITLQPLTISRSCGRRSRRRDSAAPPGIRPRSSRSRAARLAGSHGRCRRAACTWRSRAARRSSPSIARPPPESRPATPARRSARS